MDYIILSAGLIGLLVVIGIGIFSCLTQYISINEYQKLSDRQKALWNRTDCVECNNAGNQYYKNDYLKFIPHVCKTCAPFYYDYD